MIQALKNKTYAVVGASSGIGAKVAMELAEQGANTILIARRQDKLSEVRDSLKDGRHSIYSFDVSNIDAIESLCATLKEQSGPLDGMAYCAGQGGRYRLRDSTHEVFHSLMLVNFYGFMEFTRCLVKNKPQKAPMRIIGISSLASTTHQKYFSAYAASKAAMEAAVRSLATELVSKNVRINTLRPAFVRTAILEAVDDVLGGFEESIVKSGYQPLGLIDPDEVAKMVAFLLSDAPISITGAAIPINGGAQC